jgi:hypothetical protein
VRRLFIGNQNDTADNDQNYSCKFRQGELFTKQGQASTVLDLLSHLTGRRG